MGWYIWCGEEFSNDAEFFAPVYTNDFYDAEIATLLGVPPGYRFLFARNYLDVWFDESLLKM